MEFCIKLSVMALLIVLVAFSIDIAQSSSCLQVRSENGPPEFFSYGALSTRIRSHHQAIIPTYKLDCCGNITEWGVDVQMNGEYTLDLQVWRPSPTVDDTTGTGCYSLVGNNRFTDIRLQNRVAIVTPSPGDYIQFQRGDVLGIYVEEISNPNNGVAILSNFTSELVWYASIAPTMATSQNGDCPYSVGSSGVLNTVMNGAPVISISTS